MRLFTIAWSSSMKTALFEVLCYKEFQARFKTRSISPQKAMIWLHKTWCFYSAFLSYLGFSQLLSTKSYSCSLYGKESSDILQNILICVPQRKENHTVCSGMRGKWSQKCFWLNCFFYFKTHLFLKGSCLYIVILCSFSFKIYILFFHLFIHLGGINWRVLWE